MSMVNLNMPNDGRAELLGRAAIAAIERAEEEDGIKVRAYLYHTCEEHPVRLLRNLEEFVDPKLLPFTCSECEKEVESFDELAVGIEIHPEQTEAAQRVAREHAKLVAKRLELEAELQKTRASIIELLQPREARIVELEAEVECHRIWGADVKRLSKEIDDILSGTDAAEAPSLCDAVIAAELAAKERDALKAEVERLREADESLREQITEALPYHYDDGEDPPDEAAPEECLDYAAREIATLKAENKRLRERLEGVWESIQFRLDDGIGGCTQTELEEWVHTLHTALGEEEA
jgi:hypothetical protein